MARGQHRVRGRHNGSGDVSQEALGADARWEPDVDRLRRCGFGAARLGVFKSRVQSDGSVPLAFHGITSE